MGKKSRCPTWWGYAKSMVRRFGDLQASEKEKSAVEAAVQVTERLADGEMRMKLIEYVFWERTLTLAGAAQRLHISESTARKWHGEFIREVGKHYKLG